MWHRLFAPYVMPGCQAKDNAIVMNNVTPPKRRFGKDEQKMKCGFSISMASGPN
jgi:hypothetical protein